MNTHNELGRHVFYRFILVFLLIMSAASVKAQTIHFEPGNGNPGASVTISGLNFDSATRVLFNGVQASYRIPPDGKSLIAVVPAGAVTGPIVIITRTGVAVSAENFFVGAAPPKIEAFTPEGIVGSKVIVALDVALPVTRLLFNGVEAEFSPLYERFLLAIVPATATTGRIAVEFDGGRVESDQEFRVVKAVQAKQPVITGLDPAEGAVGRRVMIRGTNLQENPLAVRFGNVSSPFEITPDGLAANVPAGAVADSISVLTVWGTASSDQTFEVVPPPNVERFEPTRGLIGSEFRVFGTRITSAEKVTLNGASVPFKVDSPTQSLVIAVPLGATTGKVAVHTPDGIALSDLEFTIVRPPAVARFTPTAGAVGRQVFIEGENLQEAPVAVRFGEIMAPFQFQPGGLLVTVPAGAASGLISVETIWGTAFSNTPFTVIPAPAVTRFEPLGGTSGSQVKIFGASLLDAESVWIGGISVPFIVEPLTDALSLTLPDGINSGRIVVRTPNGIATSDEDFKVARILAFTPSAPVGGDMVIHFEADGPIFGVAVGGVKVGAQQIRIGSGWLALAKVPEQAVSGPLHLDFGGFQLTSRESFVVGLEPVAARPRITGYSPGTGLVGDRLNVSGENLTNLTLAVQVAGRLADYRPTPEGLEVTIPSGAVRGDIRVITLHGVALAANAFQVTPYTVRRGEPVCFAWDANRDTNTVGYQLYILDSRGSIFHREKLQGKETQKQCVTLDFSSLPAPNGTFTALLTAYDKEGVESLPSGRIVMKLTPSIESISTSVARVGDAVQIQGEGLNAVTEVRLGAVPLEYRVVSANAIEAVIPPSASSGTLEVFAGKERLLAEPEFFVAEDFNLTLTAESASGGGVVGGKMAIQWRFRNSGPKDAREVSFRLEQSAELKLASLQVNGSNAAPSNGVGTWMIGSVAHAETIIVTAVFEGTWPGFGSVQLRVAANPPDLDFSDNFISTSLVIFPRLELVPSATGEVELRWDGYREEFVLQKNTGSISVEEQWESVSAGAWGGGWGDDTGKNRMILPASGTAGFFRLRAVSVP